MGVFGDNLRRERELRGITLNEISEATKISKRWLKALEDEEFTVLPGGVFNRGFVRAYARFLGLNEETAVSDYVSASNEQQPPEDRFPLEIHEKPKSLELNPKRSVVPVLLAVVALVLVVGGWAFWTRHKVPGGPQAARHPEPVATPLTHSAPLLKEVNSVSAQDRKTAAPTEPEQDVPETPPAISKTQAAAHQTSANADKPAAARLRRDAQGFSVVIKAHQNSWISIAADGKPFWEGTLTANAQRSVTAGRRLVLKTGNAAGIEVSYNGKDLGTLGKDKEVRTLTFDAAGLQQ